MFQKIYSTITAFLSLFACIWLLSTIRHIHPQRRSFPLKMIFVLGVSDLIQAIDSLIYFAIEYIHPVNGRAVCEITEYPFWISAFFSLFWSTTLSVFTARGMFSSKSLLAESKKAFYLVISGGALLSTIVILPLIKDFYSFYPNDECHFEFKPPMVFVNFAVLFLFPLTALAVTVICYIIVAVGLRKASSDTIKHWMIKPSYLMWYPASQLVLYIPYIIAGFCVIYDHSLPNTLDLAWRACLHSSGLINSIVFLKMRRDIKKTKKEESSSERPSYLLPISHTPYQNLNHIENKNYTLNELSKSN